MNRGIIETIETGVVTSSSLMVNMPACDDAVRRLAELRARNVTPSVGLHLNIVAGPPISVCDSLVDQRSGRFLALSALAWKALTRALDKRDVQRELDAQLEKAEQLLAGIGLRVTHIDSHRHAHCLPVVFDVVTRTARRHGIGHVRHPYESRMFFNRPHAVLASRLLRMVVSDSGRLDDVGFTGVGAMGSRSFGRDVVTVLEALPVGTTELMVHPGYDSPELAALDPYRAPRERELRALTSPELRDRIRDLGVELTRFGATAPPA